MRYLRACLVAAGVLMIGYAAWGAISDWVHLKFPYLRYLVLVWIAHDLIVLPLAIGLGVLIGRYIPAVARPVIQAATFISAIVVVIALPSVLGFGRAGDLPSALPRDYGRGLLIVLAAIWLGAGVTILARRRLIRAPHETGASARDVHPVRDNPVRPGDS